MRKILLTALCFLSLLLSVQGQPNLYGTTPFGGTSDNGVLFSYNAYQAAYTKLLDFNSTTLINPSGNTFLKGIDNKLYWIVPKEDKSGGCVIFYYDPATLKYTKAFDSGLGNHTPVPGLIIYPHYKFYGNRSEGLFSFDPSTGTYTNEYDFNPVIGTSSDAPALASNGKVYGTLIGGDISYGGTLYSFDPATKVFKALHYFDGFTGDFPVGKLVEYKDGKLYGVTITGGNPGYGVIYSFNPADNTYSVVYNFNGSTDGSMTFSSLSLGSDGNLYGMTSSGGSNGYGVVYSFNPVTKIFTKLHDFDGINGGNPHGSVIMASDGKLYGMTSGGGLYEWGVVFSYDIKKGVFQKLQDFNRANGALFYYSQEHLLEIPDCEKMKVSIPDSKAISMGVEPNTVYPGYSPAASLKLTAEATSGKEPYHYTWSTGATTASINVNPVTPTSYTAIITDAQGCMKSVTKEVKVVNVQCGAHLDKVVICQTPPGNPAHAKTICVSAAAVSAHLAKGSNLGACNQITNSKTNMLFNPKSKDAIENMGLNLIAIPNPTSDYFTITVKGNSESYYPVDIRIFDLAGRVIETRKTSASQTIQIGRTYRPGMYVIEATQENEKAVIKVIKQTP